MMFFFSLWVLTISFRLVESTEDICPSTVSGRYGTRKAITCHFPPNLGVYWFEETDGSQPLVRLESGLKTGRGLETGEYDISDSGDFIIKELDWHNEQTYTALIIEYNFEERLFKVVLTIIKGCVTPTFGIVGRPTIISCDFRPNFLGVYWFDETKDSGPLIRLESNYKVGPGYESGAYDLTNNGSLVVKEPTNRSYYKVIVIDTEFEEHTYGVNFVIEGTTNVTDGDSDSSMLPTTEQHHTPLENEDRHDACPPKQSGLLGEQAVIVCNFEPNSLRTVEWFTEYDNHLVAKLDNGTTPVTEQHRVTINGSLEIRRIRKEHEMVYRVRVTDTNLKETVYVVNFTADRLCEGLSEPAYGQVNETARLAIFWCNAGYILHGKGRLHCERNSETMTWGWNGKPPTCERETVHGGTTPFKTENNRLPTPGVKEQTTDVINRLPIIASKSQIASQQTRAPQKTGAPQKTEAPHVQGAGGSHGNITAASNVLIAVIIACHVLRMRSDG